MRYRKAQGQTAESGNADFRDSRVDNPRSAAPFACPMLGLCHGLR
jgi:hypothetical protein